jgi:hypothetical protein
MPYMTCGELNLGDWTTTISMKEYKQVRSQNGAGSLADLHYLEAVRHERPITN